MRTLNKDDFKPWGRWVAPTLAWELMCRWTRGKVMSELIPNAKSVILVLDGYSFFLKESQKQIDTEIAKHIEPFDTEYFARYISLSDRAIEDFMSLVPRVETESTDWRNLLKDFFTKYKELGSPWMTFFVISDFIELKIRQLAKENGLSEEEVLLNITPTRRNFSGEAKEELLAIQSFAQANGLLPLLESKDIESIRSKSEPLAEKIQSYVEKNEWIGTHHFWGTPYTMGAFFDEVLTAKRVGNPASAGAFSEEFVSLLELAGYCSWLRLQCAEASDIVAYAFRPILNKAAETMGMTYDDVIWLSHEEILDGISGRAVVSLETIARRKKGWGAILTDEKTEIFDGEDLAKMLDTFIEKQSDTTITEFSGTPTSKGYAKGRVRIVFVPHHVTDFNTGDILVAPETTPDFVPHMKNASAIITDQGGITSHAAIISREMHIPCIVGTKIATQILKDGDLVEVDADNGIVRLLMDDLNALVKGKRWQFSWDRRMTYQKMRLFSYAYHHELPKMFGVSLRSELYRVKDFIVSECYDAEEYAAAFAKIEERFADGNSIGLFETLMELIRSFEGEFRPYVEAMPTSYDSYDNGKLALAYQNFCEVEHKISLPNWVLFVPFEEIITRTLRRALAREVGDTEKVEQIIKSVSLPHKMIPLDALNKALYEIALAPEGKRGDLLAELAQKFVHWGTFDVIYPEASLDSFKKKLAAVQGLDVQKLLAELEEKYRTQTETTKTILESWKQNAYVYGLLNLYSHYANYKDWKNYYREQSSYKLKILLQEIAGRVGLSLEETAFLTGEETTGALCGDLTLDSVEIDKRTKNSAYLFFDGALHITTDAEMLSIIDASIAVPEKTEIRGVGAYLGKVMGTARIIISSDDFDKLKAGDILVTSTTRPDYVPIMALAAGFVTNEGGLLSHAAIVARELKKPCIIGTKIATQVLHDGDLVEVDANNGVVRILEKKA